MWLIILGTIAVLFYIYYVRPLNYWKIRGVKNLKALPFFGSFWRSLLQRRTFYEDFQESYDKFKNEGYYGMFSFSIPVLILSDIELIKQIGIKDFDHFTDHQTFVSEDVDPLWSKNLFASTGERWRHLRPTLSPSFTGSKMKIMFHLMSDCAEQFANHFAKQNEALITVEMKDTFTRFTNDVIATCAFGIKCDSLDEPTNEFYLKGCDVSNFTGIRLIRFMAYQVSPMLAKFFKIKIFSDSTANFFRYLISDTIKQREDQGIIRPDMIHLLMETRKGRNVEANTDGITEGFATVEESNLGKIPVSKTTLTDEEITAQAMVFFLAGFDTVSTVMMYAAYELAINTDVQEKLIQEIKETWEECNGKLTYEVLMKMKYLDMVISETLRKWPPTAQTDRICTKDYKFPGNDLSLTKGAHVSIPILNIHRDPDHYKNPDKFDPERFGDENKANIKTGAYIPFGIGPRNCIGSRFALMENKILFFHMLRQFDIVPVGKSVIPVVMSKKSFNMLPEGGMWLGFKKRKDGF